MHQPVPLVAGVVAAFIAVAATAAEHDLLLQSPFVHCAFYRNYEVDQLTGDHQLVEGKSDSLRHFQGIDLARARARAIDTTMAGTREVRIIRTEKYVHFVDEIAGMNVLTTVHSCLERHPTRGYCVNYAATNAKLFDPRVMRDPDKVFEGLKGAADVGFCDYSFIGIPDAALRSARRE